MYAVNYTNRPIIDLILEITDATYMLSLMKTLTAFSSEYNYDIMVSLAHLQ